MRALLWFLPFIVLTVLALSSLSAASTTTLKVDNNDDDERVSRNLLLRWTLLRKTRRWKFLRRQRRTPSVLVGAYYYPWYHDDFHRNHGFLRAKLEPPQLPELGLYNDRDEATCRQHLEWCMDSNINLWVMSWFGPGTRTDVTGQVILNYVENQVNTDDFPIDGFKFAMLYETPARVTAMDDNSGTYDTGNVRTDIEYLAQYFSHSNQLWIDGKPVVYVYLTRWLEKQTSHPGLLPEVINEIRLGAADAGYPNIYIVGDHAFFPPNELPQDYKPFSILDAVTNYDVFGAMQRPLYAEQQGVDDYYQHQLGWSNKANAAGCDFIPSSTPGFNNLGLRTDLGYGPMSRRLTPDDEEGSLFEQLLIKAKALVDAEVNIVMITSFNEFNEDTQIEPLELSNDSTSLPDEVTWGLEYGTYSMEYLDIVKEVFGS